MSRVERNTYKAAMPEYFSDFLVNFDRNPLTGLLTKVSNEDAIKQSIYLTVLTSLGERFYHPYFGSKVETSLFELEDQNTIDLIKMTIEQSIRNHEKRADLKSVELVPRNTPHDDDPSRNAHSLLVQIKFECVNIPGKTFDMAFLLKRIR